MSPCVQEFLFEGLERHAGLLCADVLNAEAQNAGELRQVIGVPPASIIFNTLPLASAARCSAVSLYLSKYAPWSARNSLRFLGSLKE